MMTSDDLLLALNMLGVTVWFSYFEQWQLDDKHTVLCCVVFCSAVFTAECHTNTTVPKSRARNSPGRLGRRIPVAGRYGTCSSQRSRAWRFVGAAGFWERWWMLRAGCELTGRLYACSVGYSWSI
jgi:hypothetical protein